MSRPRHGRDINRESMFVKIGRTVRFQTSAVSKMTLYEAMDVIALEFYSSKLKKNVTLNLQFDIGDAGDIYYGIIDGINRKEPFMITFMEPRFNSNTQDLLCEEMMLKFDSDDTYHFE